MTDDSYDRRAELIAAALASELTDAEAAELDALRAEDPTVDRDLADFGVVLGAVRAVGSWEEPVVAEGSGERIAAAVRDDGRAIESAPAESTPPLVGLGSHDGDAARTGGRARRSRRRGLVLAAGAAACVALGIGGGVLIGSPSAPPDGPAGALGAVEAVSFDGEPTGVDVDGDVVAHTWGTETLLTIDGLPTGEVYDVVVLDGAGREWSAGTFLGSEVTITCSMNASVLRSDAVAVSIRADDGTEIAAAPLASVEG